MIASYIDVLNSINFIAAMVGSALRTGPACFRTIHILLFLQALVGASLAVVPLPPHFQVARLLLANLVLGHCTLGRSKDLSLDPVRSVQLLAMQLLLVLAGPGLYAAWKETRLPPRITDRALGVERDVLLAVRRNDSPRSSTPHIHLPDNEPCHQEASRLPKNVRDSLTNDELQLYSRVSKKRYST